MFPDSAHANSAEVACGTGHCYSPPPQEYPGYFNDNSSKSYLNYDSQALNYATAGYDSTGSLQLTGKAQISSGLSPQTVTHTVTDASTGASVSANWTSNMGQSGSYVVKYSNGYSLAVTPTATGANGVIVIKGVTWNISSSTQDGQTYTLTWSSSQDSGSRNIVLPSAIADGPLGGRVIASAFDSDDRASASLILATKASCARLVAGSVALEEFGFGLGVMGFIGGPIGLGFVGTLGFIVAGVGLVGSIYGHYTCG